MNWLERLFEAQLTIGNSHILWREIVGNVFGFASAIGGMRRRVWAWPAGIVTLGVAAWLARSSASRAAATCSP